MRGVNRSMVPLLVLVLLLVLVVVVNRIGVAEECEV